MIFTGITTAKEFQDKARKSILNGDMPIYKLDILINGVKEQLEKEGYWKDPFKSFVNDWLEEQKRTEWILNILGTIFEIGMAVAAFFTGGATAISLYVSGSGAGTIWKGSKKPCSMIRGSSRMSTVKRRITRRSPSS